MENSPITENDTKPEFQHYTVMLNEAVDALIPDGAVSDKILSMLLLVAAVTARL